MPHTGIICLAARRTVRPHTNLQAASAGSLGETPYVSNMTITIPQIVNNVFPTAYVTV